MEISRSYLIKFEQWESEECLKSKVPFYQMHMNVNLVLMDDILVCNINKVKHRITDIIVSKHTSRGSQQNIVETIVNAIT